MKKSNCPFSENLVKSIDFIMELALAKDGYLDDQDLLKKLPAPWEGKDLSWFEDKEAFDILVRIRLLSKTEKQFKALIWNHYQVQEKGFTFKGIENYYDDLEAEKRLKRLTLDLTSDQISQLTWVMKYRWLPLFLSGLAAVLSFIALFA